MKQIAVIGTGYVGLTVGNCLAKIGHSVTCVDKDVKKIETLSKGKIPIFEPGMKELVLENLEKGNISFSTSLDNAVQKAEIIFIAVGTPMNNNGKADLTAVREVAEQIGKAMNNYKVIVNKSTVPVGTGGMVKDIIAKHTSNEFDIVSNPEFLREGMALKDFMEPDRIVIGNGNNPKSRKIMEELYAPLNAEMLFTDVESAELIKYASNSFLATKISFINEIANFCEKVGADVEVVAKGMGMDKRIGSKFLKAGLGYGGSCFPKDVKALINSGKEKEAEFRILETVEKVNDSQKISIMKKAKELLGSLEGKNIAVMGLAFKPNTDDIREAPSLTLIPALQNEGAKIQAYDPVVTKEAAKKLENVIMCNNPYDAVKGADAILLITEWEEFKKIDLKKALTLMNSNILIDGRNIFSRKEAEAAGFKYMGVGR